MANRFVPDTFTVVHFGIAQYTMVSGGNSCPRDVTKPPHTNGQHQKARRVLIYTTICIASVHNVATECLVTNLFGVDMAEKCHGAFIHEDRVVVS